MSSEPVKPVVSVEFPKFVYSARGSVLVTSLQGAAELVAKDGPGVWFDSPAKVPPPVVKPVIDWQAKFEASEAENAELRKVNSDLVAKLMAKPEPKPAQK